MYYAIGTLTSGNPEANEIYVVKSIKSILDTLMILFVTLALLVTFEIGLRIIFPGKNNASSPGNNDKGYAFDKDYLVSLKPNIKKTYARRKENGGDIITWRTNSNSFRGNELKKNPGTRIIVYGDSNIQARFSKLENTFTYRLENYLREAGIEGIEVINAGVVGFGPDQSLIRFTKEADVYKPDIVIFHLLADNDFGDIMKNRLFELDSDGNLIETGHRKRVDNVLKEKTASGNFVSSLYIIKMIKKIKRSEKKELTPEDSIEKYALANEQAYAVYKKKKPRLFSHFGDFYDLDIAISPDSESSKTKIDLMNGVLKRAKNIADAKGISFLVLIQPSLIDITKNFHFSYEHLQKYPGYRRTNLTNAVKRICIANNIDFVNLFDVFSQNNPETLFFRGNNNHWNDKGQDMAAKDTMLYITDRIVQKKQNQL